jgi:hypothetical protein
MPPARAARRTDRLAVDIPYPRLAVERMDNANGIQQRIVASLHARGAGAGLFHRDAADPHLNFVKHVPPFMASSLLQSMMNVEPVISLFT